MKKEIVSGKYLICIVGIMLLCFTSRFPGSDVDLHEMTLMAFVTYGKSQLLQMGEMASSYSVAVSFRDMEWFIVLLPVMSVLPVVTFRSFFSKIGCKCWIPVADIFGGIIQSVSQVSGATFFHMCVGTIQLSGLIC